MLRIVCEGYTELVSWTQIQNFLLEWLFNGSQISVSEGDARQVLWI